MNIREHSSKFTVYVFTSELDEGAAIKVSLSQAGYDAYFFQDAATLEQRFGEAAPHILIFSTEGLGGSLSDFVEKVRKFNEEIKLVIISTAQQFEILSQYNGYGLEEILSNEKTALAARANWAVDRICEKIYLLFQNEQLFEDWKQAQAMIPEAPVPIGQPINQSSDQSGGGEVLLPSLSAQIADYKSAQSKEELIQKFMKQLVVPAVYFKFLPSVGSFVATHSHGFDANSIQGIGGHLEKGEIKNLHSQITMGQVPASFAEILKKAFQFDPARVLSLYVHSQLEGVVVYSNNTKASISEKIAESFGFFCLNYSHFCLEKKVDQLEVQDFVTEVYNRNYYFKALQMEFERARRLRQPLTVVKLAIDDFYEIEQSQGEAVRDVLLKSLASLVSRTSRTSDLTCRTQMNEFAMILPHCSRKGAALRAERLRRIVESTSLMENGIKVSISLGISEFPGMCHSPETLDETSTKALSHILDKGGNKICLYKAPEDHKPEFEVPAE